MRRIIALPALLVFVGCVRTINPVPEPVDTGIQSVLIEQVPIQPNNGVYVTYQGPYSVRTEAQISGLVSGVRTKNRRPIIILDAILESADRARLVKLEIEPKDSSRHVKYSVWTAKIEIDPDWVIPVEKQRDAGGRWIFTPVVDLVRGEYAIWHPRGKPNPNYKSKSDPSKGAVFYAFGIDD